MLGQGRQSRQSARRLQDRSASSDYRSRTPGGLEVERFYNSAGYFRFDVAPERSTDVWRTTWDRRIVLPPVAGTVLAYAQRADGSILVFLPSGREMHNNQGGGVGAAPAADRCRGRARRGGASPRRTATSRPTTPPAGCWRSTLRAGWTYALAYGANGRLATVTDTFGGKLTFTYDASGRLERIRRTRQSRLCVRLRRQGPARVASPIPTTRCARTTTKTSNFVHALTGITDENGARFATWSYDGSGRANSSQHAGGVEAVTLYYGSFSRDGQRRPDHRGRCVRHRPAPTTTRSSEAWRASATRRMRSSSVDLHVRRQRQPRDLPGRQSERRRTTRTISRAISRSPAPKPTAHRSRARSRRSGIPCIDCRPGSPRRRASPASSK